MTLFLTKYFSKGSISQKPLMSFWSDLLYVLFDLSRLFELVAVPNLFRIYKMNLVRHLFVARSCNPA